MTQILPQEQPADSTTPADAATSLWTATRDELRTRRAARLSRRDLERNLAHYGTSAEITEIQSILARYEGPDAIVIREALDNVRVA